MSDQATCLNEPAVAHALLRSLMRDLQSQVRNGLPVPRWAPQVLTELAAVANVDRPDVGTRIATLEAVGRGHEMSVSEAAHEVGLSREYVRRLVSSGRVIGRRVHARTWLVDIESLRGVTNRASTQAK